MKKEIMVNIPMSEGEDQLVVVIEAKIDGDILYIKVEDEEFRTADAEFPAEATEDNITAKLLKSAIGRIKRVGPEVLIGKKIIVDIGPRSEITDVRSKYKYQTQDEWESKKDTEEQAK